MTRRTRHNLATAVAVVLAGLVAAVVLYLAHLIGVFA